MTGNEVVFPPASLQTHVQLEHGDGRLVAGISQLWYRLGDSRGISNVSWVCCSKSLVCWKQGPCVTLCVGTHTLIFLLFGVGNATPSSWACVAGVSWEEDQG